MNDKYEIVIKKNIMCIQEDTKGSCNMCSILDDDRGLNITEIIFRGMIICLCDHHKNILLQKLTSDNSDYAVPTTASPKLPSFSIFKKHMQKEINEGMEIDHLLSAYHTIKKLGNFA